MVVLGPYGYDLAGVFPDAPGTGAQGPPGPTGPTGPTGPGTGGDPLEIV